MSNRKQTRGAPVIRCHPATAAFLGAVRVDERRARRAGDASIPVRTSDGARWLWPIEDELRNAIERA